jgi:hypothetical protein
MARDRFSNPQIVERSIREFRVRLLPQVQPKFEYIVDSLRNHFRNRSSRFDSPNSRKWFTVKLIPQKAIIAFRTIQGSIEFDIDTYPDTERDIVDERNLFTIRPNPAKPNKVYVAAIDINTSADDLNYFIRKIRDAIDIFEN